MPNKSKQSLSSFLKLNQWWSIAFLCFFALSAVLLSLFEQGHWVLFFSERRSTFWDFFFKYGTRLAEAWVMLGALIILLFVKFRAAITLPIMLITVALISNGSKQFFAHPRPYPYYSALEMEDQLTYIEGVKIYKGHNSFPSGHTMAGFAIFAFLAFNTKNKKWIALGLFGLALIVGISRIYLVQHFLKDVYLGSFLGFLIAILAYYFQGVLGSKAWLDKNLLNLKKAKA